MKSRISAVEGSLDSPAFFESEPMLQLAATVTHIVHSAASVSSLNKAPPHLSPPSAAFL